MAWQHVTFRVVTGNPFGLDKNRYGHNYSMKVSLDDDLTTEQLIQLIVAEQFIASSDAPRFAFRMIPVHRHLRSSIIDTNEDNLQEQWQNEQEHYRRSPNPPLVPGRKLKEEYPAPVMFVEGIRREFLPYWKQGPPNRDRWGDRIDWCEPIPPSDNELKELKQRFRILSFSSAPEDETVPVSESGSRGTPLDPVEIIAMLGSVASVTQVILMVAEMWSKKAKGKVAKKMKQGGTHAWDEVKEIRVRMSDGTSVQFESWLAAPENVRSFVETFRLPSQSPKPLWVSFLLKNGAHMRINVAEDITHQEELEAFIYYLKL
jgi:hypothetical protein